MRTCGACACGTDRKSVNRSNGTVQIEAELPSAGLTDQLRNLLRLAEQMTKRVRS